MEFMADVRRRREGRRAAAAAHRGPLRRGLGRWREIEPEQFKGLEDEAKDISALHFEREHVPLLGDHVGLEHHVDVGGASPRLLAGAVDAGDAVEDDSKIELVLAHEEEVEGEDTSLPLHGEAQQASIVERGEGLDDPSHSSSSPGSRGGNQGSSGGSWTSKLRATMRIVPPVEFVSISKR